MLPKTLTSTVPAMPLSPRAALAVPLPYAPSRLDIAPSMGSHLESLVEDLTGCGRELYVLPEKLVLVLQCNPEALWHRNPTPELTALLRGYPPVNLLLPHHKL